MRDASLSGMIFSHGILSLIIILGPCLDKRLILAIFFMAALLRSCLRRSVDGAFVRLVTERLSFAH